MLDASPFPYACLVCSKAYKYKKNLMRHVKHECNMEPKYVCNLCPFKTKQQGHLKLHMIRKHQAINY